MATTRELQAELEVLEMFDRVRTVMGHDYGGGQRAMELRRRLFVLDNEHPGHGSIELTGQELLEAFERIGRPRLERLATEGYRAHTPASKRTRWAWGELERYVRAAVAA